MDCRDKPGNDSGVDGGRYQDIASIEENRVDDVWVDGQAETRGLVPAELDSGGLVPESATGVRFEPTIGADRRFRRFWLVSEFAGLTRPYRILPGIAWLRGRRAAANVLIKIKYSGYLRPDGHNVVIVQHPPKKQPYGGGFMALFVDRQTALGNLTIATPVIRSVAPLAFRGCRLRDTVSGTPWGQQALAGK